MTRTPSIHHFNTDPFNWYVVEEAGRITLVDAGLPGHFGVFAKGLRSLGREITDVDAVILTHAHADHMGFADRVSRAAKAQVWIHREDVAAARRVLQLPWFALLSNGWRPFVASTLTKAIYNRVFSSAHVSDPKPFSDGDVLDVPGRPQVMHVPGHTPGSVGFYFPSADTLICGDALVTRDLYTGRHSAPQLMRPPLNHNNSQARKSIDRFADLGHLKLLTGHGRLWEGDLREAVERAHGQL